MMRQAKCAAPTSRGASRRSSEDKMSLRSTPRETSDEDTPRKPRLSPRSKRKTDEDTHKTSWKDQLKFRSFIGRRESGPRDRVKELKIVHLGEQPPPPLMREDAVPAEEECRESAMTPRSVPIVPSPEEPHSTPEEQQPRPEEQHPRPEEPEDWDDCNGQDEFEAEEMDYDEEDPFHLEEKVMMVDLTSQIQDLQMRAARERGMSISHMSESSDESRSCSPLPFIYEDEVATTDHNEDDSDSDSDVSPDHSPGPDNHISWNWAEPIPPAPPVALAPAPAPKPNPATSQPPSPTDQQPPPPSHPGQLAAAVKPTYKANMVMLRRPSRPDNPWSWKLPAPDPSAPKINTVIVRRPSRKESLLATKPSGLSPRPPSSKPPKPLSRRPSRLDDSWSLTSSSKTEPRRPSRCDGPLSRPPLPPSSLSKASPVNDENRRRPSRPQDALGSHPVFINPSVDVRQDSEPDPLCRMCLVATAEAWGVCQECDDEATSPPPLQHDEYPPPPPPQPEKPIRPQDRLMRPAPLTTQNSFGTPSVRGRYATASLASNPEANEITPPISPMCRTVHNLVSIPPPPPPTSLSALPTPEVLARLQYFTGPGQRTTFFNNEWPDYYLDSQVVQVKGHESVDSADSVASQEAQGYMQRELSLEEYDGFWGSPVSPGPGWI
ncbi:hypothetical protein AK830_g5301 [Neonectria ditissima]|uniref:Uncharacterized protein n=1 Tax=Neonectria ditissima TaxID=78410 RepID=A0A0N8H7A7_9HYPO|nr:hypothetical protein AK830_g5301 [Neonectria ditissima]